MNAEHDLDFVPEIPELDAVAMQVARDRLNSLTKPEGSFGRLEDLAVHLAGITGHPLPTIRHRVIFLLAADHGVAVEGVSAYPQAVTAQMVASFLQGRAGINVLARRAAARVRIADLGVAGCLPSHPELRSLSLGPGTRNLSLGPAMLSQQAVEAIRRGMDLVSAEVPLGLDLAITGDMGIANTTAAAAIVAAMTRRDAVEVTGHGTGIDAATWRHKVDVIERALGRNDADPDDPVGVLASLGGFEIGGLAGVMLAAAQRRCPVILDGVASGAAALIATALRPALRSHLIAGHCSVEPGHAVALRHLRLDPLLSLNMRLGEGTGATIALHLVDDALAIAREMRTFAEAGVSEREAANDA
jgi:nicotinate-nucleotide--dimethylbenzimidazole phosphoribosyltransferase